MSELSIPSDPNDMCGTDKSRIDGNLDALHGAAKRLNALGRAIGEEVETQNKHIDRIITKTDKVDDQVRDLFVIVRGFLVWSCGVQPGLCFRRIC